MKGAENYILNSEYLKKTFYLVNNQLRKSDHERWFCIYRDVKELLRNYYFCQINELVPDLSKQYSKLAEDFEQKMKKKKEDWAIKAQKNNYS